MIERLALGLFILGCMFVGYLYGVASTRLDLVPYPLVRDALVGGKALYELWSEELERKPPGLVSMESGPATDVDPAEQDPGAPRELILVTGGMYKLRSECPEFGCLAWITDRAGKIYHTWPFDPDQPWGELAQEHGVTAEDFYPESLYLYDNGDLLVSYQVNNTFPYSVGIARFDKDGKVLWKNPILTHHKFDVDPHGTIYAPAHEIVDGPLAIPGTPDQLKCAARKIYADTIVVLDPDGKLTRRISVLQALFDSGYGGLVALTPDGCDPLHLNDVRVLTEDDADAYPTLAAGDLLISLRNLNTIAVLDGTTERVKWTSSGQMVRQHAPRYLGADGILVFDNLGGPKAHGGSRLLKIDVATGEVTTLFPNADTPSDLEFYTEIAGQIDLDAARERALVALTMEGRGMEIDLRTGDVLWQHDEIHDVTEYMGAEGGQRQYGRLGLSGLYYVDDPSFLNEASPAR